MAKPLIFVTGFFGAGKTTLLRSLAAGLLEKGYSADVILNDFADARLDAATLTDYAASIAPIAANCACCGSLDELMSLTQAASAASGDVLLIELNGSTDPLPVLEAFTVSSTQFNFSPRVQVNLVDARHWGKRDRWNPIERRQLETAGAWILSHLNAINEEQKDSVVESVTTIAPHAQETDHSRLLDFLLSQIQGEAHPSLPQGAQLNPASSTFPRPFKSDPVHQLTHHFEGWTIPLPGRVRQRSIENLLSELPSWIVRAKAIVKLVEQPGDKWLFQRIGSELDASLFRLSGAEDIPSSLVCIGPNPDQEQLKDLVRCHFGGEADALFERALSAH